MEQHFEEFIELLMDKTYDDFLKMPQYALLVKMREELEKAIESLFAKNEQLLLDDLMSNLVLQICEQDRFFYRRGMRDGMQILKQIGLIA